MKNKKKLIIIIASAAVAVAAALVAFFATGVLGKKSVNVYPISELLDYGMTQETEESYGTVRVEGFQYIDVSDTQQINEIYVTPGQHVSAGDAILSYDTTLTDLELEKADLEVKKAQLDLNRAYARLNEINSLVPMNEVLIEPDNSWIHYEPVKTPYLQAGKGTMVEPFYYIIDDDTLFDNELLKSIVPAGSEETYFVFMVREHTAVNGEVLSSFGLVIYPKDDSFAFKHFDAEIPAGILHFDAPDEPYYKNKGSDYTAEEIVQLRAETQRSIKDFEIALRIAELDYQKMVTEAADNVVRADKDGEVKIVRKPEDALAENMPVVEISAGGGYYIDLAISELKLGDIHPGDKVTITSFSTGEECEGTVDSVSSMPADESFYDTSATNPNVSFYPYVVFVPAASYLTEGDYVSAKIASQAESDDAFYLENMFVRRENGKAYVYVMNSENGRLEKRNIETGKILYSTMVQIKKGLSKDEMIAFPYGKNVKAGAKCIESEASSLYDY